MPIYLYKCSCGKETEKFLKMKSVKSKVLCGCGKWASRLFSAPALITDTSFCMTGKRDSRFDNVKIEGRKHWESLVKSKGYVELTKSEMNKE